ncbi:MAG: cob(I)yrinic acid a,c-diamide adenosyltransferase [Sulfolobales archaeon]
MKKIHFGDDGFTLIAYGVKLPKEDLLLELLGGLDELNSFIGLVRSITRDREINELLKSIQDLIFRMGRDLAIPIDRLEKTLVSDKDIEFLEKKTEELWERIREPKNVFIYPSGSQSAALLHVARAVCRRVERTASRLYHERRIYKIYMILLNRLSDLLFVAARYVNQIEGFEEEIWRL